MKFKKPKGLYTGLAFMLWSAVCLSFATSFSLIGTYQAKGIMLSVDNFSNFYCAEDNKVLKFSPDGEFLYPYEEFKLGKIGMVDVSNPLKVLVFYPDFLKVQMLDKFLSPLTIIDFFALGYQNVSAVASSADGDIWFYDNIDMKLKKIDENGAPERESQQLNLLLNSVPNPNFMLEKDNVVYLNDPAIGIMVFDNLGSYAKTVPIKGLNRFQVFQDQILYFQDKKLNTYNLVTFDLKSLTLPDSTEVIGAALQKNRLGLLKKDRVDFYKY